MKIRIEKSRANGEIFAPPSKSVSHRALICAALSDESRVFGIKKSDDLLCTVNALKAIGANISFEGECVTAGGLLRNKSRKRNIINCNESASTLRFLIPLCAALDKNADFVMSKRLAERPICDYCDIFRKSNVDFTKNGDKITVNGKLNFGDYVISSKVSSQFASGLLMALPLLDGDSTLTVLDGDNSASYVDLTVGVLKDFGINTEFCGGKYYIRSGQRFASTDYCVEADFSNAAYIEAFNYAGGNVLVKGTEHATLQGDGVYKQMLERISRGGKSFDMRNCPDLAPVMFCVAALYGGAEFHGINRLKYKESNRTAAMQRELCKFGIRTETNDDVFTVFKSEIKYPDEILCGHNDHRIVMALALLCSVIGGTIDGAQAVSKSFPDYFKVLEKIGIKTEIL